MLPSLKSYFVNQGLKHFIGVAWMGVNVVLFYFTFMYYYTGSQFYYLHKMLGLGLCISRASASCINLNSSLLLIPMCKRLITSIKGSSNWLIGRQARRMLDQGRSFHIYCGHLLCLLAVIHCGAHGYNVVYFSKHYDAKHSDLNVAKYANENPLIMLVTSWSGITGLLLVITLIIIATFASKPLRRKKHNRFWATHHMFVVFYGLLLVHAMDGVIKYQTNVHEHVPGCLMIMSPADNSSVPPKTVVIPEPEPHAEPGPMMKKHMTKRHVKSDMHEKSNKTQNNLTKHMKALKKMKSKNLKVLVESASSNRKFHQVVIPEPEPISHGGSMKSKLNHNFSLEIERVFVNGSWVDAKPCHQPHPKFASCPKEVWIWLCIPLALYLIERLVRLYHVTTVPTKIVSFKLHPSHVIELKLSRDGFKAKPGQNIWVRCPSISHVELHPFSLTSVPCKADPTFGIHIKVLGDWTCQLRELLKAKYDTMQLKENKNSPKLCNRGDSISINDPEILKKSGPIATYEHARFDQQVTVSFTNDSRDDSVGCYAWSPCQKTSEQRQSVGCLKESNENELKHMREKRMESESSLPSLFIEGPTGSAMEDIYKYKVSLCVAGGIGVTPFASVLNALLKDNRLSESMKLQRLHFVWACRSIESFEWFADLIETLHIKLWNEGLPDLLNIHLYLTGSQQVKIESNTSGMSHLSKLKRCRLTYQRPDISEIIQTIATRYPNSTVGVFCCGPRPLLNAVKSKCLHPPSSTKTKFIFNKEAF